jgi:hypothetical protein
MSDNLSLNPQPEGRRPIRQGCLLLNRMHRIPAMDKAAPSVLNKEVWGFHHHGVHIHLIFTHF